MANSAYQYVRDFEQPDALPPSNWIVVRIDGRGFSKFTTKHSFAKPNDLRAINLMNAAALEVTRSLVDVVLAYGQSDEYSFVLSENTTLFDRRAAKLATTVATAFTAEYCMLWPEYFPNQPLTRPFPTFDARCVCYPKRRILRDYLCWRQADCHINNLYNTTFWNMVLQGGMSQTDAELELKGTVSSDKNEILFKRFGINYNNEPLVFRKGSIVYRKYEMKEGEGSGAGKQADPTSRSQMEKERKRKMKAEVVVEHVDLIGDAFWEARPWILAGRRGEVGGE
ncbi:hypothetical protein WHR41_01832 [Cladosporium halotolerans]|uniref:tRNA(His) guanylyltransferase n=1 Tax=Cladosporium halotolerans TaxID=1052096 RepID=A0AB34L0K1_9PEZI